MATFLMPTPRARSFTDAGVPAASYLLYTYAAGTTTPKAAFTDAAGLVPHPNPIVLDAKGEAVIFYDGNYKLELKTPLGVTVTGYPVDNFETPVMPSTLSANTGGGLIGFLYGAVYGAGSIGKWLQDLAQTAGASFVGFANGAAGSKTRTVENKLRDHRSITDFSTIVADGTDQTAAIVAYLGTLPSNYAGLIEIPFGVKCNFTKVCAALPAGAIVRDDSCINAWYTGGYQQNLVGYTDQGKADASVDLQFRISSGHNAGIILDNRGTAGSNSGNTGIGTLSWGRGQLTKVTGQEGVRTLGRMEWTKIPGAIEEWWCIWRREMPWAAQYWEYWYANVSWNVGDHCRVENRVYRATTGGTSGATAPNWLKGVTASDGGVSWICVDTSVDQGIFGFTEKGAIFSNTSPVDGVSAYFKASPDGPGSAELRLEGTGASKIVSVRLNPTTAAGAVSPMPLIFAQDGVGIRITKSDTGNEYSRYSDANGLQMGAFGHIEGLAANGDTTPSVLGIGLLRLSNTVPTSITTLDEATPVQQVMLWAENGNTTLIHNGSSFVLKGGISVTLLSNQVVTMKKYSASSAWFEIGRNF